MCHSDVVVLSPLKRGCMPREARLVSSSVVQVVLSDRGVLTQCAIGDLMTHMGWFAFSLFSRASLRSSACLPSSMQRVLHEEGL